MKDNVNIVLKRNLGKIIFSAILIVLGLVFVIFPSLFVNSIGIISGVILLLVGILGIILSLMTRGIMFVSIFSIIISVVAICFGITFIVNPDLVVTILPIFLICYLLINGVSKIFSYIKFKEVKAYILDLIVGIIFIILGITLIFFIDEFNSFLAILVGVMLLIIGLSSLIEIIIKLINTNKKVKIKEERIIGFKGKENAIDADIVDIKDSKDE